MPDTSAWFAAAARDQFWQPVEPRDGGMARTTAVLEIPAAQASTSPLAVSATLMQALLALGLEIEHSSRLQLAATATAGPHWPVTLQVVISWSAPPPGISQQLALELQSREPMATGAPRTQQALQMLLEGMVKQLPELRVLSTSGAITQGAMSSRPLVA